MLAHNDVIGSDDIKAYTPLALATKAWQRLSSVSRRGVIAEL